MLTKRLTFILLAVFLILAGLAGFVSALSGLNILIAILALAAGILILVKSPGISYSYGWIAAAIYLILRGLLGIVDFGFSGMGTIMAILALAAGVLLLIKFPGMKNHIGFLLFCAWLLLVGLTGLISLGNLGIIVSLVALSSGILLLLDK